MGTEELTAPESGWDVQAAIQYVRATSLLKRLDSHPNENIEETVVEIDDEWDVRLSTTLSSGEAVCYRLIVEPHGTSQRGWTASVWMPPGGVTSSLLRKIPLASILEFLDQVRAGERDADAGVMTAEGGRVRGPMPLSDEWICVVAAAYVLGFITKPQAPLQGTVAALGEGYSYATVREHVQRARDKGFLAATRQGQARLELGPRWREVIGLLHESLPSEIRATGSNTREADWLQSVLAVVLSCSDEATASELMREVASAIAQPSQ